MHNSLMSVSVEIDMPFYYDLIGLPFTRGARGPKSFDCWGLVRECYKRQGIELPDFKDPGTYEGIEAIIERESKSWRRAPFNTPHSVVTFRVEDYGAHVGYMLDNQRFIHAIDGAGVCTPRLDQEPWKECKIAAYVYG